MQQNSEIDALKSVCDILDQIPSDAQLRVLSWANANYLGHPSIAPPSVIVEEQNGSGTAQLARNKASGRSATAKTKRPKNAPRLLKELNFVPGDGKPSLKDFIATKTPANLFEKCTVVVYYFINHLAVRAVSLDHVFTAFKAMEWRLPNDLRNIVQQTGSKGWLDTSKSSDIKLTPRGDNLVEHDLPRRQTRAQ
jgi:hypothetical protein